MHPVRLRIYDDERQWGPIIRSVLRRTDSEERPAIEIFEHHLNEISAHFHESRLGEGCAADAFFIDLRNLENEDMSGVVAALKVRRTFPSVQIYAHTGYITYVDGVRDVAEGAEFLIGEVDQAEPFDRCYSKRSLTPGLDDEKLVRRDAFGEYSWATLAEARFLQLGESLAWLTGFSWDAVHVVPEYCALADRLMSHFRIEPLRKRDGAILFKRGAKACRVTGLVGKALLFYAGVIVNGLFNARLSSHPPQDPPDLDELPARIGTSVVPGFTHQLRLQLAGHRAVISRAQEGRKYCGVQPNSMRGNGYVRRDLELNHLVPWLRSATSRLTTSEVDFFQEFPKVIVHVPEERATKKGAFDPRRCIENWQTLGYHAPSWSDLAV